MKPQLIIDCGGGVLSALLVTADGELVPCSHDIRQVAARHVSQTILFEPRVVEHSDFIWEDAIETLSKANAQNFFQRARRIGLRRPWDAQASAEALQLASPLAVLSSPAALADRTAGPELRLAGLALLDALLEPAFAFAAERQLAARDIDAVVVLPDRTGPRARLVLHKLFRRRGFRRLTLVRREVAAAMALVAQTPCACIVAETSESDLHLHRVDIDGDTEQPRFRTTASITLQERGRSHWIARIADASRVNPSASFDRSLTALLTGSPESLPPRLTHDALQNALDESWIRANSLEDDLREPLADLAGDNLPLLFAGEIFALDAVRALFGARAVHTPLLDDSVRNVALAMRSRFTIASSSSLRVSTFHGRSIELLSCQQLPAAGEACRVDADFRIAGDGTAGKSLLVQLLWGNATLCAIPVELRDHEKLRLTVQLRRSRGGSRLHGAVEARIPRDVVVAHARFAEELEVSR
jgi:hypothetical protein